MRIYGSIGLTDWTHVKVVRPTTHQRWQVETVFSMIKRNLGSALHGRSYWSQCRELMLLAITHNIMIILPAELFYRAGLTRFFFGGEGFKFQISKIGPRFARAKGKRTKSKGLNDFSPRPNQTRPQHETRRRSCCGSRQ